MKTEKRKNEHIKTAMKKKSQYKKTNLFEQVELIHNPLLDCELKEIKTQTNFLGKKFSFPFLIRPITGGTKKYFELNKNIALACEKKEIGFALGSMRAGLESKSKMKYFTLRKYCPTIYLEANIGALELSKYSTKKINAVCSEIQADAISVHLNAAQELMQNTKTKGFSKVFKNVKRFAEESNFPVIVKEVGNGISFETAKKLNSTEINAIDVAGRGGTSFVKIDSTLHGKKRLGKVFGEFGVPTAASVLFTRKACKKKKIIASGGIRNGLDVCKSLVLGADLAGIAVPALQKAKNTKGIESLIDSFQEELIISMFLIGAKNTKELKKKKFVLQDNLKEWQKSN